MMAISRGILTPSRRWRLYNFTFLNHTEVDHPLLLLHTDIYLLYKKRAK
jgi:hypothetical protein